MIRVPCNRRGWQPPILVTLGLAAAMLVGCGPEPAQPKPEKETPPAAKPQAEVPVEPATKEPAAKPQAEKPVAKEPAAKSPVYDPPIVEVEPKAKDPAAKPQAKVPAANPPAAGGVDETLRLMVTPTPAWMPKPAVEIPEAQAANEAAMKPYTETIPGTEVKFDLVPIRGGKFLMGSPETEKGRQADESPQHEVRVDPFWMETHEVTWEEYELWGLKLDKERRRINKVPSTDRDLVIDAVANPTPPYTDMSFGMGKDGYPAVCMTQFAAKMYCKWLSAKTGRYYRLPTEAEWEYACRAGSTTAFSYGDDPKALADYAWFTGNSDDKYHKIAKKKPNPWGLYDMHGNVAEWVLDQHTPDFYKQSAGKAADNPLAPATTEYNRVVRGGSWDDDPEKCRSAARRASEKDWKKQDPQLPQSPWYLTDGNFIGFRVVRPLRMPTAEEAKKYEIDRQQIDQFKEYMETQANKQ